MKLHKKILAAEKNQQSTKTILPTRAILNDYLEVCKPRVVALMMLTAIIAMFLALPPNSSIPWLTILFGSLGIALSAAAGGSINHIIDQHLDAIMNRTKHRPLPSGRVKSSRVMLLATLLTIASLIILFTLVNTTVAILSLFTLIGYAGIYTLLLKRLTPQNIVNGGLAGAMPPLLGWSAISGNINSNALILVLIIFTWTPPHFWTLAIYRHQEYAQAKIPMLPVTHGIPFTKLNILFYTLLMLAVTYFAFAINLFGLIYLIALTVLNILFLQKVIKLYRNNDLQQAFATFRFSISYLGLLFLAMLVDHFSRPWF